MNPVTHLALSWLSVLGGSVAFSNWHHALTHGLFAAAVTTAVCVLLARRKLTTALLALAAFHLHLLCDLFGSGGDWTIRYLYPLSPVELYSPLHWDVNSWPNFVITLAALAAIAAIGVRNGRTVLETFLPVKVDRAVIETLRRRFARKEGR